MRRRLTAILWLATLLFWHKHNVCEAVNYTCIFETNGLEPTDARMYGRCVSAADSAKGVLQCQKISKIADKTLRKRLKTALKCFVNFVKLGQAALRKASRKSPNANAVDASIATCLNSRPDYGTCHFEQVAQDNSFDNAIASAFKTAASSYNKKCHGIDVCDSTFLGGSSSSTVSTTQQSMTMPTGIGINIVGGLDQPHLPDEPGIFVSYVAPDGMAARDGRIKIGDQIVSINGRPLEAVNHEEAVAAFRSRVVDGGATVLVVERDAEARILAQPILARPSPPPQPQYYAPANNVGETKKSSVSQESSGSSAKKDEPLKIGNNSATTVAPSPSASEDQPTAAKSGWKSAASNNHADEVPRTPRRPLSVFDPRNPSWTSELIFVSIGVATIALAGFAIYRWSRR